MSIVPRPLGRRLTAGLLVLSLLAIALAGVAGGLLYHGHQQARSLMERGQAEGAALATLRDGTAALRRLLPGLMAAEDGVVLQRQHNLMAARLTTLAEAAPRTAAPSAVTAAVAEVAATLPPLMEALRARLRTERQVRDRRQTLRTVAAELEAPRLAGHPAQGPLVLALMRLQQLEDAPNALAEEMLRRRITEGLVVARKALGPHAPPALAEAEQTLATLGEGTTGAELSLFDLVHQRRAQGVEARRQRQALEAALAELDAVVTGLGLPAAPPFPWRLALIPLGVATALLVTVLLVALPLGGVLQRLDQLRRGMEARAAFDDTGGVAPLDLPDTIRGDEVAAMAATVERFLERLRQREDALAEARDVARQADEAKSVFLANMSHEIRTPMNAVIGLSQLALRAAENERQRDYLTKIQGSSRALLGLINDVLDFSKIEAGKVDLERIPFGVAEVLDDVAALVGNRAEEKGLEVVFATDPALPLRLEGDPLRLGQVLTNLCTNAVKFTEVGEVVVRADLEAQDANAVTVHFTVRDTGIGMSAAQKQVLFQPFAQGDASTTRRFGGTGLGLSICRHLVALMDGKVWVDSAPGRGSTFHFTAQFGRATAESREAAAQTLRNMRILVVDDNATTRAILNEMLTATGCHVSEATNGRQALAELERVGATGERPYDVVLMDWRMPEMDGLEASHRIKENTALGSVPVVIMVTAYGRDSVLSQEEHASTIDGVLTKPVNPSMLMDTMVTLMQGHAAEMTPETRGLARSLERPGADLHGRHVLLVEDNAVNQQVAREILQHWGVRVSVATDGREALLALHEAGPDGYDAVLMDVQMPVMDGITATRTLREDATFADLPVVAMTAHALAAERRRCLDAGMNDHVSKPVDPDRLYEVLATVLRDRPLVRGVGAEVSSMPEAQTAPPAATGSDLPDSLPGLEVAAGLRRVMHNEPLYRRLLADFRRDFGGAASALRAHVDGAAWGPAREQAHTLKGVAANIGATDVAEVARAVETAAGHEDRDTAHTALAALADALATLEGTLAGLAPRPTEAAAATEENIADGAAARAALDLLEERLVANDLDALGAMEDLRAALGPVAPEVQARLAAAVSGLDFARARDEVATLRQILES